MGCKWKGGKRGLRKRKEEREGERGRVEIKV